MSCCVNISLSSYRCQLRIIVVVFLALIIEVVATFAIFILPLVLVAVIIRGKWADKNVISLIPRDTNVVNSTNRMAFINLKYGKLAREFPCPLAGSAIPDIAI